MELSQTELRGPTAPWGTAAKIGLLILIAAGLWLRLRGLSAEGFGDDEVHKWLAANRYLQGDFGGDDVEHPMLMKWLISFTLLLGSRFLDPETITRLPNALVGGLSIWVVAQLGRRLFGRMAGLFAAALTAFSVTLIGYQRVAKEDALLGLFLMLLLWCMAEAKAAPPYEARRWEVGAAASLAGLFASKYFFFLAPIPVVFYLWQSGWRVPLRRWLQLIGIAALLWAAVNWSPFLPSTWEYARTYLTGKQTVHGSLFFMGRIYHNLVEYGLAGTPPWFYAVFAAVKLAPATFVFAVGGLFLAVVQRKDAHKLILSWLGVWFLVLSLSGSKWGRFFVAVLPGFLLLAGHAAAVVVDAVRTPRWAMAAALVLLLPGGEALAAALHSPHYRLYISPLGGGDAQAQFFFPHCDYFDAGFREAVQYVAEHAEPQAEISSEIDWTARLYSERAGRSDLSQSLVRRGRACRSGHVCYAFVQVGRLYFFNQEAVENLAHRPPWHVESIEGQEVVKVYRLLPGESPFPGEEALVQHE
ncbi:MAG: phospholipid carrier-dependent glycosyltransferase [Deltaproteobacteria bacterium]|nr:MAG: phospholipid carrier-dependent glycosyltransferase [Deltaproteobacteria bacterium]